MGRRVEVEDLVLRGRIRCAQFLAGPPGARALPVTDGWEQANSPEEFTTMCTGVVSPVPPEGVSSNATPSGGCTAYTMVAGALPVVT